MKKVLAMLASVLMLNVFTVIGVSAETMDQDQINKYAAQIMERVSAMNQYSTAIKNMEVSIHHMGGELAKAQAQAMKPSAEVAQHIQQKKETLFKISQKYVALQTNAKKLGTIAGENLNAQKYEHTIKELDTVLKIQEMQVSCLMEYSNNLHGYIGILKSLHR